MTNGMGAGPGAGAARTKVVACATVVERVRPLFPVGVTCEVLDFGLHLTPHKQQHYREVARLMADRLGLRHEEIPGSTALIKKMINGPWDGDFVVARPGAAISYADFVTPAAPTSSPNIFQ